MNRESKQKMDALDFNNSAGVHLEKNFLKKNYGPLSLMRS